MSLLATRTASESSAPPDSPSLAVLVTTVTSLWFGGQMLQPGPGIPLITGGVTSVSTMCDT